MTRDVLETQLEDFEQQLEDTDDPAEAARLRVAIEAVQNSLDELEEDEEDEEEISNEQRTRGN